MSNMNCCVVCGHIIAVTFCGCPQDDCQCKIANANSLKIPNSLKTQIEEKEAVNHPSHYSPGIYETINVIEAWKLDFHLGNAVKYISRAGKKDFTKTKQDIEKSIWYLQRYISNIDKNNE